MSTFIILCFAVICFSILLQTADASPIYVTEFVLRNATTTQATFSETLNQFLQALTNENVIISWQKMTENN